MSIKPRNVLLICLSFFFIFFGFGTAQQYLIVVFSARGQGNLALLSLFLLYGAFLISGIAAAKIISLLGGLKRAIILGACTYALFTFSVAINNTALLIVTSLLIGVGASLLWVSSGQLITDSSEADHTGRNLSYQIISMYFGNIIGINIGGYLIDRLSLFNLYSILALAIAIGTIFLFWVKPVKEETKKRLFRLSYLFDRRMLALFPLIFGAYVLQAQVFTAINLLVVSLFGVGYVAFVVIIIKISNIIGSFGGGALAGQISKSLILVVQVILALLGIWLFVTKSSVGLIAIGAVMLGLSMAAIYPVSLAWLKERIPEDQYIYALGIFHVYANMAIVLTIVANRFLHSDKSFIVAAVALLLALPGIWLFSRMTA